MSYCRFQGPRGDESEPYLSDVYAYPAHHGDAIVIECCACMLSPSGSCETFSTPGAMLAHLRDHLRAGHAVPERAFERLEAERAGESVLGEACVG